eukprot:2715981-Prymnesium_polylepis.2
MRCCSTWYTSRSCIRSRSRARLTILLRYTVERLAPRTRAPLRAARLGRRPKKWFEARCHNRAIAARRRRRRIAAADGSEISSKGTSLLRANRTALEGHDHSWQRHEWWQRRQRRRRLWVTRHAATDALGYWTRSLASKAHHARERGRRRRRRWGSGSYPGPRRRLTKLGSLAKRKRKRHVLLLSCFWPMADGR